MKRSLAAAAIVFTLATAGTATAEAAAVPDFPVPEVFGTSFQKDSSGATAVYSPHSDGILRGWITRADAYRLEYEPIRWKRNGAGGGRFVGPLPGSVSLHASAIEEDIVYLSVSGCGPVGKEVTVNRRTSLGVKRCSDKVLLDRAKKIRSKGDRRPALITIYRGVIVKVQEIHVP